MLKIALLNLTMFKEVEAKQRSDYIEGRLSLGTCEIQHELIRTLRATVRKQKPQMVFPLSSKDTQKVPQSHLYS